MGKYILDKDVARLISMLRDGDYVFYSQDAPDYVLEFLRRFDNLKVRRIEDFPAKAHKIEWRSLKSRMVKDWPDKDDLPKYICYKVTEENCLFIDYFLDEQHHCILTDESLSQYITRKEYIESDTNLMSLDFHYNKGNYYQEDTDATVLQVSNFSQTLPYRRWKLRDYLKNKIPLSTGYTNKPYDVVIFSSSNNALSTIAAAIHNKSFIVFDRTDNWSALSNQARIEEELLFKHANIIFCSAKYLYNTIPSEYRHKAIFVPNGCYVREFTPVEKFSRKTAIYAGMKLDKFDKSLVETLAESNKDWDFLIYNNEKECEKGNVKYIKTVSEDEIYEVCKKCHIGLIPFVMSSWTDGMLPLKVFTYANARIPVAYSNCNECKPYEHCFSLNKYTLDEILEQSKDANYDNVLKDADWNSKFDFMYDTIFNRKIES